MSRALDERASNAKRDTVELERLISEYKPFILGCVYNRGFGGQEDAISVALEAFYEAVRSYSMAKGGFLPYAGRVIQSRLVDAKRREAKHSRRTAAVEDLGAAVEGSRFASVQRDIAERREACRNEIAEFSAELAKWGISMGELAASAPRHALTKAICRKALCVMLEDVFISERIESTGKLPMKELAGQLGIGVKVLDRHRRYLIAAWLIRRGDYSVLREYVPLFEGKAEETR